MIKVTQTAEATITDKLTATDMRGFLNAIPGDAEITFSSTGGELESPVLSIKATWTKAQAESLLTPRPPVMRQTHGADN